MNFLRAQTQTRKKEEEVWRRLELVATRLRTSSYPEDKEDAVENLYAICAADSVLVGSKCLEDLVDALADPDLERNIKLYKMLLMVVTGDSREELLDILYKKQSTIQKLISGAVKRREYAGTLEGDIYGEIVRAVSGHRPRAFGELLVKCNDGAKTLIEMASAGNEDATETLQEIARSSRSLKKVLVFESVLEKMMHASSQEKQPQGFYKKSLSLMATVLDRSAETQSYFLELRWAEFLKRTLDARPSQAARIIHKVVEEGGSRAREYQERIREEGILARVLEAKDPLAIYLLTRGNAGNCKYVVHAKSGAHLNKIRKEANETKCAFVRNCLLGSMLNIGMYTVACSPVSTGEMTRVEGVAMLLARPVELCDPSSGDQGSSRVRVNEEDVLEFLFGITEIKEKRPRDAVTYLLVFIQLMGVAPIKKYVHTDDIMNIVNELLRTEETEPIVKYLCAYVLGAAYVAAEEGTSLFGLAKESLGEIERSLRELRKVVCNRWYGEKCVCSRACGYKELEVLGPSDISPEEEALSRLLWIPEACADELLRGAVDLLEGIARRNPRVDLEAEYAAARLPEERPEPAQALEDEALPAKRADDKKLPNFLTPFFGGKKGDRRGPAEKGAKEVYDL